MAHATGHHCFLVIEGGRSRDPSSDGKEDAINGKKVFFYGLISLKIIGQEEGHATSTVDYQIAAPLPECHRLVLGDSIRPVDGKEGAWLPCLFFFFFY